MKRSQLFQSRQPAECSVGYRRDSIAVQVPGDVFQRRLKLVFQKDIFEHTHTHTHTHTVVPKKKTSQCYQGRQSAKCSIGNRRDLVAVHVPGDSVVMCVSLKNGKIRTTHTRARRKNNLQPSQVRQSAEYSSRYRRDVVAAQGPVACDWG